MNSMIKFFPAILAVAVLTGCGGGSSSSDGDTPPAETATGQFVDAKVAGLAYASGSVSGITNAEGHFNYEVGKPVTFSIGGITLGQADGDKVVSPIDLFAGGSASDNRVRNVVRLLMMLDEDGNPDNGIQLSAAVQTQAENWSELDFSLDALQFESALQLQTIITDAQTADGGSHLLPSETEAGDHLTKSLYCAYSGAFTGTYSGKDSGSWGMIVNTNGNITGAGYSSFFATSFTLEGSSTLSLDGNRAFTSGSAVVGADFSGSLTSYDKVSGEWQNAYYAESGPFAGTRLTLSAGSAKYRASGLFDGGDLGLFAMEIATDGTVSGYAYSVAGDALYPITGSYDEANGNMSATASDGTTTVTITGYFDPTTESFTGSWENSADALSGTFDGTGCEL